MAAGRDLGPVQLSHKSNWSAMVCYSCRGSLISLLRTLHHVEIDSNVLKETSGENWIWILHLSVPSFLTHIVRGSTIQIIQPPCCGSSLHTVCFWTGGSLCVCFTVCLHPNCQWWLMGVDPRASLMLCVHWNSLGTTIPDLMLGFHGDTRNCQTVICLPGTLQTQQ